MAEQRVILLLYRRVGERASYRAYTSVAPSGECGMDELVKSMRQDEEPIHANDD